MEAPVLYNKEVEDAVLGAILIDRDSFLEIESMFKEDLFYFDSNKAVCKCIMSLFIDSDAIDVLTVANKAKEMGLLKDVGGPIGIASIGRSVSASNNILHHCRILQQYNIRRSLVKSANNVLAKASDFESDPLELLGESERDFLNIGQSLYTKEMVTSGSALQDFFVGLDIKMKQVASGEMVGVPCGLSLDDYTGGFHKATLVIIAGRPGMGKSAAMNSMAIHTAVERGIPTAVFNLEMSIQNMMTRMVCHEAEVPMDAIKNGSVNAEQQAQMMSKTSKLAKAPLFLDDTPSLDILELRSKAMRLKKKHGIGIIFIDYIQLMTANHIKGNRDQVLGYIAQSLKDLSKELDIPVIALAQLSRATEMSDNKLPELRHLRESGNLEQAPDQIVFVYRPEYYGITEDEEGNDLRGIAQFILAKNRDGKCGTKTDKALLQYAKFVRRDKFNESHIPNESKLPPAHEVDLSIPYSGAIPDGDKSYVRSSREGEDLPF